MKFSDGLFAHQTGDGMSPHTRTSQGRAVSPDNMSRETADARLSSKVTGQAAPHTQISLCLSGIKDLEFGMLTEYKNVVELDLQGTDLKELPYELLSLRFLKKLKAGSNLIAEVTNCPFNLEFLTLDRNKLSNCSNLFRSLTQIVLLDLSHNELTSLEGISACTTLRYLNVKHNLISAGVEELETLTGLQEADISHNQLSDPEALSRVCSAENSTLQVFNFEDNPCVELMQSSREQRSARNAQLFPLLPIQIKSGVFAKSQAAFKKSLVCKSFRGWPYVVSGSLYEKDLAFIEGTVRDGLNDLDQQREPPITRYYGLESIQEDKVFDRMQDFEDDDDYDLDDEVIMGHTVEDEAQFQPHTPQIRPVEYTRTDSTQVISIHRTLKFGKLIIDPEAMSSTEEPLKITSEYWLRLLQIVEPFLPEIKFENQIDVGLLIEAIASRVQAQARMSGFGNTDSFQEGEGMKRSSCPSTNRISRDIGANQAGNHPGHPRGSNSIGTYDPASGKDNYADSFRSENSKFQPKLRNSNTASHKCYTSSSKKHKANLAAGEAVVPGSDATKRMTFNKMAKKEDSRFRAEATKNQKKRAVFSKNLLGLEPKTAKLKERSSIGAPQEAIYQAEEVRKRATDRRFQKFGTPYVPSLKQTVTDIDLVHGQHGLQGLGVKLRASAIQNTSSFQSSTFQEGSFSKIHHQASASKPESKQTKSVSKKKPKVAGQGISTSPFEASPGGEELGDRLGTELFRTKAVAAAPVPNLAFGLSRNANNPLLLLNPNIFRERWSLAGSTNHTRAPSPGRLMGLASPLRTGLAPAHLGEVEVRSIDKNERPAAGETRKASLAKAGASPTLKPRPRKKSQHKTMLSPELQPRSDPLGMMGLRPSLLTASFLKTQLPMHSTYAGTMK